MIIATDSFLVRLFDEETVLVAPEVVPKVVPAEEGEE